MISKKVNLGGGVNFEKLIQKKRADEIVRYRT